MLSMAKVAIDQLEDGLATALEASDIDSIMELLVERYGDQVYRYCRRMLGNDVDGEDVSQVVFVQVLQGAKELNAVRNMQAYILGIARHRCLDRLKAMRRAPQMSDLEEVRDVADPVAPSPAITQDQRVRKALDECLDRLDERSRAAVVLRFHDELSFDEMSAATSDTPGALRVRVARALPALRRCLEQKGVML